MCCHASPTLTRSADKGFQISCVTAKHMENKAIQPRPKIIIIATRMSPVMIANNESIETIIVNHYHV